jgi:Domain of unknown function (DUF1707)
MVGPGDEIAAGAAGQGRLRASQADREQVLDALKAAFVQGLLAKDEFDLRVGRVLATYAELDALTVDIPAGLTAARPPEPARESNKGKLVVRGTAAGAGTIMVGVAAVVTGLGGNPLLGLFVGGLIGSFAAVLLAGFLMFLSWVLDKGFGWQHAQGPPPGASGKASRGLASADPAGGLPQIGRDPRHGAEAVRSRPSHPPWTRAAHPLSFGPAR